MVYREIMGRVFWICSEYGFFLVHHNEFGWLAFGGNIIRESDWITMEVTTAARSRIFIAAEGIELVLDAGKFRSVSYHPQTGKIRIVLEPANEFTPQALLRITPYPDGDLKKYVPKGFSKIIVTSMRYRLLRKRK